MLVLVPEACADLEAGRKSNAPQAETPKLQLT